MTSRRVLFITPQLDDNSTGRTYALWLITRELGWSADVLSFEGAGVWEPLQSTEFAKSCQLHPRKTTRARRRFLRRIVGTYDLVISVKPLRNSFHVASPVCQALSIPHIVDIDDPDLQLRLSTHSPLRAALWRLRYFNYWLAVRNFNRFGERSGVIVSNPHLQDAFGGVVVPHVREASVSGAPHTSEFPQVAFVGTAREHKGINELRAAVSQLAEEGFRLIVTDDAPPDARTWESWVGRTTLDEGARIVAETDIVAIPSRNSLHSRGQLPAKIMDAAAVGRAIIVADVPPLPWAVQGDSGVVADDGVPGLVAALRELRSPTRRSELGVNARRLFEARYSVKSALPTFLEAVSDAELRAGSGGRRSLAEVKVKAQ